LKNFIFFENAPSYAFLFLSNTLFLESKIKEKNGNAKVNKVGDRTGTEGAFTAVKILSVKPLPINFTINSEIRNIFKVVL